MEIKEIKSKSILVKSNLPDTDYVINPYVGCRFGCTYCYASFMGRFNGKKISDWGEYVHVKVNAPELLEKEVRKLKKSPKEKDLTIFISSVTDPYQGLEAKYKITRQCLRILQENNFKGNVSILTKSDLVLRDMDIIEDLYNAEVGLTVTSTDDSISRYFEKFAPSASQRLKTLKRLNENGIRTYAFIGPFLPHYVAKEKELEKLISALSKTGVREVYVEHINLSNYILGRLKKEMKDMDKNIWDTFYETRSKDYRDELDVLVHRLLKKHDLKLRLGETIYHPK